MIHKITDENFDDQVRQSPTPWVLDFTASWCGLCEELEPRLEQISQRLGEAVRFGSVDSEEQKGLRIKFAVGALPYLVFVKDGMQTPLFDSLVPEEQIEERIRFMLDGGEAPTTRPLR